MRRALPRGRVGIMALAFAAACGDDGGPALDAAPIDAPVSDGRADAEDLCPGQLTIEGHTFDLADGGNLFDVAVSERAMPRSSATSAPNGRVLLCVDDAAIVELLASGVGLVDRVDPVSKPALARLRGAGHAHPIGLWSTDDAAALAIELAVEPPGPDTLWAAVHVVEASAGTPLLGATVELDAASAQAFTRQADGAFVSGATIAAGGVVLVVAPAVDAPALSVTPPGGFAGDCVGPAVLATVDGAISGAAFACD